jgi:hypothetical protein
MTSPESIKGELNAALIGGIRQRGPDAVGMVIIGIARLIIGAATLGLVLGLGTLFGYDMTAVHLTGATAIAGLVSWWTGATSRTAGRRR